MNFKPNWYKEDFIDIPTFQELNNVTGKAFDRFGNYIGPKEAPEQQLVIDQRTGRQYFAPKAYDEDNIRYAAAKFEETFSPEEWWGMVHDPHLKWYENIASAYIEGLKGAGKLILTTPHKVVSAAVGNLNARTGQKIPVLREWDTISRAAAKNWEDTLNKAGFEPEIHTALAGIGGMLGQTGGSLLVAAVLSSVGGLPAVAAVFGSRQYADIREEYLEKGYTFEEAHRYATLAGLAEGGLEAVGFKFWKRAATMNKSFRNYALSALPEVLQEGGQTSAEALITNATGLRKEKFIDIAAEIALSMLIGGLVGVAGAAVTGQSEIRYDAMKTALDDMNASKKALPNLSIEQEFELAYKNKNNKLYNIVANIAGDNPYNITDKKALLNFYKYAKKLQQDGTASDMLLNLLGNQITAYANELKTGKAGNSETVKEAAEQIKFALSKEKAEAFRAERRSELENAGFGKRMAEILSDNMTRLYVNISNKLGVDIAEVQGVNIGYRPINTEFKFSPEQKSAKEAADEEAVSFDFGANAEAEAYQANKKTKVKKQKAYDALLNYYADLQKQYAELEKSGKGKPRSNLLSTLRREGANYNNAGGVDKEQYKNMRIPNKKNGIGDNPALWLRDRGFMSFTDEAVSTYDGLARENKKAEGLILKALNGEAVYSLDNQAMAEEAASLEAYKADLASEIETVERDLTRGQINLGGKVAEILLGDFADFSTAEHEFIHYIDNIIKRMAAKGNKAAQELWAKREEIVNKHWDEFKSDADMSEAQISAEIIAEAYEKWLYSGQKAEDAATQKLFTMIRDFFRDIYRSLKAIGGVEVTEEVDAFFREISGLNNDIGGGVLTQRGIKSGPAIVDLSAEFANVAQLPAEERGKAVEKALKEIIGRAMDTATPPLQIQVTAENKAHVASSNIKLKKGQLKRHQAALLTLEKIVNTAKRSPKNGDVDLSHNTSQRTIAHKQNVEEYVYFETIVQIGQEEYLIELAAERVKGQDKNLLDLYNVHVKRNPATTHLSALPQGFSKDSITDKNGKIKAYFINFEGELKHTTNSEGKPIGKSFAEVYNFYRWFGDSKAVDEQGRPLVVYHGTDASFTAFDMSKGRANMDIRGAFFSPWEEDAKGYGSRVGSYYLSIQNPADESAGYAALRRFQGQNEAGKKAKAYLQSLGYDSVINNNEEYIAFEPRQIKSVDNRGTFDPNEDNIYYQRAYHGTPYEFDRFSLEAIGTGEGAQAHGWGLYFAKNKGTAEDYKDRLSERLLPQYPEYDGFWQDDIRFVHSDLSPEHPDYIGNFIRDAFMNPVAISEAEYKAAYEKALDEYYEAFRNNPNKGKLYEVEIPEDDVLLDEEKPLREQPEPVRKAILAYMNDNPDAYIAPKSIDDLGPTAGRNFYNDVALNERRKGAKGDGTKEASQTLNKYGIKGITYDGRQDGRSYVIFDDKAISIVDTYYQRRKKARADREQKNRDRKAREAGAKAADAKPSKEEIERDIKIIESGQIPEGITQKSRVFDQAGGLLSDLVITIRQRAGTIDKRLKYAFDKLDYNEASLEKGLGERVAPFIEAYQKLDRIQKNKLNYFIYNNLTEYIEAFTKEIKIENKNNKELKTMYDAYKEVRQVMNFIYQAANMAGINMGFIEEYFPTSVKDYGAFTDYLKGTDKWTFIEKGLNKLDPKGIMGDKEKTDAINKMLKGYNPLSTKGQPKNAKKRTILKKDPNIMQFYEDCDVALMKYITSMSQAFAVNKAFGVTDNFNSEDTIGAIVLQLIKSGTITRKEEELMKGLLRSRLSYRATPEVISWLKNIGYLGTMNNLTSAITQIGDLYAPFYKYGFGTAIEAIFGKREITKKDLGLDRIWEEFSDKSKTGVAVDKVFKAIGLNAMDKFGKEVSINASWRNMRKKAQKPDIAFMESLSAAFGKNADKVLNDIKNGNITNDVKLLIWCDLADTQPIGKSGVPKAYLDNPHGRIFYQLKTYMTNQISLYYADGIYKIYRGAAIKDKKMLLEGAGNLFKLAILLTAANATGDVLKNLITGRQIDISDTVISNLLWNIGVSKYTFYKGKRDGFARALFTSYVTPPQLSSFDDIMLDAKKISEGKREVSDSIAVTYVPFGRMYYWWLGGGRTSEEKKGNKPFNITM